MYWQRKLESENEKTGFKRDELGVGKAYVGLIVVYIYFSCIIINSTLFQSQKYFGLDDKLIGSPLPASPIEDFYNILGTWKLELELGKYFQDMGVNVCDAW